MKKQQLLKKGMHIVVGLSGGPDSLCMFDVLCRLAEEWDLRLHPVHVNHKLRPGAAEEDQAFVEAFCRERGWPCRSFVFDCNAIARRDGLTPEEAGRKVRYEAFRQVAGEIASGSPAAGAEDCAAGAQEELAGGPAADLAGSPEGNMTAGQAGASADTAEAWGKAGASAGVPREKIAIAVAQNAGDQCETILFRLLRGSGPDGLAGIAYKRYDEDGNAVIRPLLDITREEIENYCRERGLRPRRDHTNQETDYMRNRIRLELIPYLQEHFNPNIVETVNRLGRAAAADKDYLLRQSDASDCRQIEDLRRLHPAVRMRVYQKAAWEAGLKEGVTAAHLEGIDRIVSGGGPSAAWSLPDGFTARRVYDRLVIEKDGASFAAGRLRISIRSADSVDNTDRSDRADGAEHPGCADHADYSDQAGSTDHPGCADLHAVFSLKKLKAAYGEDAAGKMILRGRKGGDYMTIFTGGNLHRRKLQDLLVDMKVPKAERDRLLVAAVGSEVLWILPGEKGKTGKLGEKGRFSASYRTEKTEADEGAEDIIVLEYLCPI